MQQEETTWKIFSSPYREEKGKKQWEHIYAQFYSQHNIWLDFPLKLWHIWSRGGIFVVYGLVCSVNISKNERWQRKATCFHKAEDMRLFMTFDWSAFSSVCKNWSSCTLWWWSNFLIMCCEIHLKLVLFLFPLFSTNLSAWNTIFFLVYVLEYASTFVAAHLPPSVERQSQ